MKYTDNTSIAYSFDNFCLHRASGTVYTALDIATGQEVSINIHFWLLLSFICIDQNSSLMAFVPDKMGSTGLT